MQAGAAPTALASVDNRPQLCRVTWHSTYQRCILLTTGPSCVPARIVGEPTPRLPPLHPVHNRSGRAPARKPGRPGAAFTGVHARGQAYQDVYLHTCTGKLCAAHEDVASLSHSAPTCVMRAGAIPPGVAAC